MPIFCDEAGYNGNDLLQEEQPYFVYAALNIDRHDADQMIEHLKVKYRLQGKEPKGINIVRNKKSQGAVLELFERYGEQVRIVYYHKKYALACKFFEYIFEPAISYNNVVFYRANFHRFIAGIVFEGLMLNHKSAEQIFKAFQGFLKGENFQGLFHVLKSGQPTDGLVGQICEFAELHKNTIIEDIQVGGEVEPWILDLAQSALYDLLISWNQVVGELEVICDSSYALKHVTQNHAVFQPNQNVRFWDPLGDGEIPVNFKLGSPIRVESSKGNSGIQLADIFASSVYYALKHPEDEFCKKLYPKIQEIIRRTGSRCVTPQPHLYIQPGTPNFDFGIMALSRLIEFSKVDAENAAKLFCEHMLKMLRK
ncbi:DUF3800 domain-containing protein [Pedobacter hiemivivus]|uniref:DUF3800 domain-containing protein n=1 Tax=Pedobacter hiemivivus TaxID=2530454 RepID=A0A4R0N6W8_9SPHI|nr:DUF3800 domain-containing protein [Pedobacter hiemivivus]TCC95013.1 DUF3800 domain-containing protein [Pedobacter hiemivivus]